MISKVFSILNDSMSLMETDSATTTSSLHTERLTTAVEWRESSVLCSERPQLADHWPGSLTPLQDSPEIYDKSILAGTHMHKAAWVMI